MTQAIAGIIVAGAFILAAWSLWREVRRVLDGRACSGCSRVNRCSNRLGTKECPDPPTDEPAE